MNLNSTVGARIKWTQTVWIVLLVLCIQLTVGVSGAEVNLEGPAKQKGGTLTAADCLLLNTQCTNNCFGYMDAWAKMICFSTCIKFSDMCMNVVNGKKA